VCAVDIGAKNASRIRLALPPPDSAKLGEPSIEAATMAAVTFAKPFRTRPDAAYLAQRHRRERAIRLNRARTCGAFHRQANPD
jgi:hypothetical protein